MSYISAFSTSIYASFYPSTPRHPSAPFSSHYCPIVTSQNELMTSLKEENTSLTRFIPINYHEMDFHQSHMAGVVTRPYWTTMVKFMFGWILQ